MTLPVVLQGECTDGALRNARITRSGAVVVAPFAYDETEFNLLGTDDVGVTFYKPKVGERFVITGMLAAGNLSISANALAVVIVYESANEDSATSTKIRLEFGITRLQVEHISPLNILVNEGVFLNAKTDDDDVFLTIMGYYIPALQ